MLCSYWQRTGYGTVRCNYLDLEVVDEGDWDAKSKIEKHFRSIGIPKDIGDDYLLSDEIKICKINEETDDRE